MHLAGIQEERGKGFWISILSMDRKQVAKKYAIKKIYFLSDTSGEKLVQIMHEIRNDRAFWEKKKQFSQLRRPPKWVDVPPRLMFRPDGGIFPEDKLETFKSLPFDFGLVVKKKPDPASRFSFVHEAEDEEIMALWGTVFGEKRIDSVEEMPDQGTHAFYSLGLALWGGEKVWRMVRYGG